MLRRRLKNGKIAVTLIGKSTPGTAVVEAKQENYQNDHANQHNFGLVRFPNNEGVSPEEQFQLQVEGPTAYHYTNTTTDFVDAPPETRNYTLVRSESSDLPVLKYKWFYFDACNSGRDYIENFEHGSFLYTIDVFGNTSSTKLFVEGIVNDQDEQQIVDAINRNDPDQAVNRFFPFP